MSRASLFALVSLVFSSGAAAQGVTRPSFTPPEALQPSTAIVARISATGSLTINNQAIPWGRLATQLRAIYGRRPVKLLFLAPHPDAVINDVLRLLDIAKQEGVIVYTLQTGHSIPVD